MFYHKYIKYKSKYRKLQSSIPMGGANNPILDKYYNLLKDQYDNYKIIDPVDTHIDCKEMFTGPFLLDEIKQNLSTQQLVCKKYNNLTFVTNNINSPIISILIKRAIILSNFLNITKEFIVVYLDTNYKKQLPTPSEIINKENVNSGYSTNYYTVVYRREEAPKVLLHELLHQFEVDCGYTCAKQTHSLKYYKNKHTKNDILYNEALVESIATILNCMMTSIESNNNYIQCINTETQFITKQVKQIMNHLNITSIHDRITTKASIFEYYILKAAILHNLTDFINFLTQNNQHLFIYNRTNSKDDLYNKIMSYTTDFDQILTTTRPHTNGSMRMTII